jgi:pyruvate formate lyase activating enzyme
MKKVGQLYSAEELLEEALQDEPFYQTSGGGVTIGGGEPLYQPEFLKEFLKACQRRSVHTALETSGYAPSEDFSQLTEMVDVVLMDLKHVDDEKHRRMTKVSNRTILRNLRNIRKTGKKIICRVPVIPGFNETEPELIQIGRFLLSVDCTDIHLLPYHRLGEGKYAALGREYPLKGVQPPAEAYVRGVSESLVRLGLNVQIGG